MFTTGDRPYAEAKQDVIKGKGKVIDLVFPILVLIISCIIGMIYTGGFLTEQASLMRLQAAMLQLVLCLEAFCVDNHHMLLLNQKGTKLYGLL